MQTPAFEELAARPGVERREKTHAVDAERFRDARETIESGLTWAVGAVVADDRGRVLLVSEDGEWLAPGGAVEAGETHHEALVREVREETGVEVAVERPVAVTDVGFEHDAERVSFSFAHYEARPITTALADDPGLPGEDITAVEWVESIPRNAVDRDVLLAHAPGDRS